MELWFSDYHTEDVKLDIKIEKQLFGADTDFQRIDVFESKEFGRFISCDGTIVFSEKDEFVYDEMIVHVPMAVHPHVRKVLVIGGGDGGVARELTHYDEIEEIDVVETDHVFIDVCRDYFPDNACGLDDPRVTVFNANGLRFLRTKVDEYDLIISDAIDPLGHAAGLFTKEFYGNCFRALKETASWFISMAVPSTMRMRKPAEQCTARPATASPSAVYIRRTFRPVLQVTGCSASLPRSIIR